MVLERDPQNSEAIHSIFRAFHTIKGLAGFLELSGIQTLAHEIETVLDEARNSRLEIGPDVADIVLQGADRVNRSLRALDAGVRERDSPELAADPALIERVHSVLEKARQAPSPAAVERAEAAPEAAEEPGGGRLAAEARTVKVDTRKLDFLVEIVGELVISSSLVRHDPELHLETNPRLQRNLAQLSHLVLDVQQTTMSMRMVPVRQLFQKTARITRDVSRKAGKPVEIVMKGEDTELDRNIIEELADPLLHMVRNSIDHGIEDVLTRAATGKPAMARLELRAAHQSGQIVVEIADDGRGLDEQNILRQAVKKGIITEDASLSQEEIFNLIFVPGFSTAKQVTDVSGRGVGMDVVKRHIQKLRGRIEIHSVPGKGATFTLKLPLTLAIIEGLVVRVGRERFIVPTISVREMLRPTKEMLFTVQDKGEMALIRGQLLPLVRLHRRFSIPDGRENPCEGLLIVAESEDRQFCLLVDELVGRQEVVIKSLGDIFQEVRGVTGGAILGDGRVGLILDLDNIPEWSGDAAGAA
jgi:two-component system chemotaxis sensor kinase CheA